MKNTFSLAILILFVLLGTSTCKKDTEITCNLSKSGTAPSDMTIQLKAISTGDGKISKLTYTVGSTSGIIENPTLPWTKSIDAVSGDKISITAEGTTKDGSLTISYTGQNATDQIEGSDDCAHSN